MSIIDMPPSELRAGRQGFIAINSTLAVEALRKGVLTKLLGKALWNFAHLTNDMSLDKFWTDGVNPSAQMFELFTELAMSKTQYNGSYYSKEGRDVAIAEVLKTLTTNDQDTEKLGQQPHARLNKKRASQFSDATKKEMKRRLDMSL